MSYEGQNFSFHQGDDHRETFPMLDLVGALFQMTGFSGTQLIWRAWDPADVDDDNQPTSYVLEYDLTDTLNLSIVDWLAGDGSVDDAVQLDIPRAESALPAMCYHHETVMTDATDRRKTTNTGEMTVLSSFKA